MAEVVINDQHLTDLAAAIRKIGGTADTFTPGELAAAIDNLDVQVTADNDLTKYIEGTLTQINDDTITTVRRYAFRSQSQLTEAILPNVSTLGDYAFSGCQSLYYVKLGSADIPENTFNSCYSLKVLDTSAKNINYTIYGHYHNGPTMEEPNRDDYPYFETIILRAEDAVCNLTIDSYYNEFSANRTSFYVPSKLKTDYRDKYSYIYEFKAIEDYPEICG